MLEVIGRPGDSCRDAVRRGRSAGPPPGSPRPAREPAVPRRQGDERTSSAARHVGEARSQPLGSMPRSWTGWANSSRTATFSSELVGAAIARAQYRSCAMARGQRRRSPTTGARLGDGRSGDARATAAASAATVGCWRTVATETARPSAACTCAAIRAASSEWPPHAKRCSSRCRGGLPSTRVQTPSTTRSTSVLGAVDGRRAGGSGHGRPATARRSIFPVPVRGSALTATKPVGSMCPGRVGVSILRAEARSRTALPGATTAQAMSRSPAGTTTASRTPGRSSRARSTSSRLTWWPCRVIRQSRRPTNSSPPPGSLRARSPVAKARRAVGELRERALGEVVAPPVAQRDRVADQDDLADLLAGTTR